jgi:hypothetical protein
MQSNTTRADSEDSEKIPATTLDKSRTQKFLGFRLATPITIQIYTAIIAFLPLQAYHCTQAHHFTLRLKDLSTLVRVGLFGRPKLVHRRHQQHIHKQQNSLQLSLELNYVA